jgi:hypothetical protein
MKIAYTSDLHLDFMVKGPGFSKLMIEQHLGNHFKDLDSEYLIVAGDTGHIALQNVDFLINLKDMYGLKEIFHVHGNHCGYLINDVERQMFPTGLHKIAYTQDLMTDNGIQVLDGTTFTLPDGVVIGGANSFYDGTIFYRQNHGYNYNSQGSLENYWKRMMNDSKYMRLESFHEYAKQQKDLLKGLKDQVDVMVTHIKPVVSDQYFSKEYRGDLTNAFYSFDFEEEIAIDTRLKAWIYGHTHIVENFNFLGVELLANPKGYPGRESKGKTIKHFEVSHETGN